MNKIILKGNLGKDPEVKSFDWGKVAKFSLATTEIYKDKKGEKVTNTEWHNVVFKGSMVDVLEKYVKKGDQILIEGKIVTRSYEDKNKVTHWATEIIGNTFEFCGTKEKPEGKTENKSQFSDVRDLPGVDDDNPLDPPF
jgi:single-strand DNA-binding protein